MLRILTTYVLGRTLCQCLLIFDQWVNSICLCISNSMSRTELLLLYSSTWLSDFSLTFLHCCSFLLAFFPPFLLSFLPSFLSFVNPRRSVWQPRCTFWLLLFPSLWPLQMLTLYFQLRARPTPAHHHWERLLCHFFVTIFQALTPGWETTLKRITFKIVSTNFDWIAWWILN